MGVDDDKKLEEEEESPPPETILETKEQRDPDEAVFAEQAIHHYAQQVLDQFRDSLENALSTFVSWVESQNDPTIFDNIGFNQQVGQAFLQQMMSACGGMETPIGAAMFAELDSKIDEAVRQEPETSYFVQQLARCALCEGLEAHLLEHPVRVAELVAGVGAPALAAQPLAVDEVGARELDAVAGGAEAVERFAVETLGVFAVAQQRARTGFEGERPVGAGGLAHLRQRSERVDRGLASADADGRFDQLGQHPRHGPDRLATLGGLAAQRECVCVAAHAHACRTLSISPRISSAA